MALFSQRAGINLLSKAIQRESIDDDLKNALWTSFHETFVEAYYHDEGEHSFSYHRHRKEMERWLYCLWTKLLKEPSDTEPDFRSAISHLRGTFFRAEWHWI